MRLFNLLQFFKLQADSKVLSKIDECQRFVDKFRKKFGPRGEVFELNKISMTQSPANSHNKQYAFRLNGRLMPMAR